MKTFEKVVVEKTKEKEVEKPREKEVKSVVEEVVKEKEIEFNENENIVLKSVEKPTLRFHPPTLSKSFSYSKFPKDTK